MARRQLTVRVPEGSALVGALRREARDELVVEPVRTDAGSGKELPGTGTVVFSAPSVDALEQADLVTAVQGAAKADEPVVLAVEKASALPSRVVDALLDAAETTPRDVVLAVLDDG